MYVCVPVCHECEVLSVCVCVCAFVCVCVLCLHVCVSICHVCVCACVMSVRFLCVCVCVRMCEGVAVCACSAVGPHNTVDESPMQVVVVWRLRPDHSTQPEVNTFLTRYRSRTEFNSFVPTENHSRFSTTARVSLPL